MLIAPEVLLEHPRRFWEDQLRNEQYQLHRIEVLLRDMAESAGDPEEYTVDTGQTMQKVKRGSFAGNRDALMKEQGQRLANIEMLMNKLGMSGGVTRVAPWV